MGQMAQGLGNSNVTDPRQAQWGDLSGGEKGARLFAGGMRGLGQGLQNTNMQPGAPSVPTSPFQSGGQQSVDPSYFQPQNPLIKRAGGMSGNFYGGSNY